MKKQKEKDFEYKKIGFPYAYSPSHGRNTALIDCPFCGEKRILIYIWSYSGCGKRCGCGAMLSYHGATKKKIVSEKKLNSGSKGGLYEN